MDAPTILLVVVLLVLAGGYFWYVSLIRRRNRAREALSSIDVQLRKRHDLLPNVLKLAGRFMAHEKELLEEIVRLRTQAMQSYRPEAPDEVKAHLEAESALQAATGRLMMVMEQYPQLRSVETMTEAQQTFTEVEGHISAARRFYNAAVTDLNNAVEVFPGSMIANIAGVRPMPFFETEEAARAPVDVDDYLR
jgi:LemA protein